MHLTPLYPHDSAWRPPLRPSNRSIEINEAFSAQLASCEKALGVDRTKLNVNGGAVAMGHPVRPERRLPLYFVRRAFSQFASLPLLSLPPH